MSAVSGIEIAPANVSSHSGGRRSDAELDHEIVRRKLSTQEVNLMGPSCVRTNNCLNSSARPGQSTGIIASGRRVKKGDAVDNEFCYLNTDLDLASRNNLSELVRAFDVAGVFPLHVGRGSDGRWHATLETAETYLEPEANISQLIAVIESWGEVLRPQWGACTLREFNIGYHCGATPWAFNQALSTELLRRIASVGASLRITLYPYREDIPCCAAL